MWLLVPCQSSRLQVEIKPRLESSYCKLARPAKQHQQTQWLSIQSPALSRKIWRQYCHVLWCTNFDHPFDQVDQHESRDRHYRISYLQTMGSKIWISQNWAQNWGDRGNTSHPVGDLSQSGRRQRVQEDLYVGWWDLDGHSVGIIAHVTGSWAWSEISQVYTWCGAV